MKKSKLTLTDIFKNNNNNKQNNVDEQISFQNVTKIILNIKKEKLNLLNNEYKRLLRLCEEYITINNNIGKTYIIFSVPEYAYAFDNYNSFDCITYIKNDLISNGFEAIIYNERTLYITWNNIENFYKNK